MRPEYYDDTEVSGGTVGEEEARLALAEWNKKTYTVECVLPSGVYLWRTYWRDGSGRVCEGITVPRVPLRIL